VDGVAELFSIGDHYQIEGSVGSRFFSMIDVVVVVWKSSLDNGFKVRSSRFCELCAE